ncbi:MAG: ABC transporter substrate-binding protein [Burkholderiales bacterium]
MSHSSRFVRALLLASLCGAPLLATGQSDPKKVLHVVFRTAETGFDPAAASDLYSNYVNRAIFEPPFRYDFRARPHKVVPNTTVALPEGNKDGTEWTIRIKPGIHFADDPAFKGKKRELTAADYAYSWKRLLDPAVRSPSLELFDGRIVGMDRVLAKAKETGKFDYDMPVEGLTVVDKYTLKLKLTYPWFDLPVDLTSTSAGAVAREVVEAYGDQSRWVMANPVGTGPYKLKEWRRGQRILLEANPNFRGIPYAESNDPADKAVNARFKGLTFPRVGQVDISIMEEGNPRVLAFARGELDYLDIPYELVPNVLLPDNKLKPQYAKAGVILERDVQPSITFAYFNMEDPVVGGYTPEKIALRRAIGMAYNVEDEIRIIRQGQGKVANMILPPPVTGYDPTLQVNSKYDPVAARALLDKFGYKDRDGDGFREMPDGTPLVIKRGTSPSALERQYDELWQRSLNAVGLKVEMVTQRWADLYKMAKNGQLQFWQLANTGMSTDGYSFLGMLYGPNAGLSNLARFKLAEFDRLYDASKKIPPGPERDKLVRQMSEIVAAYAPWKLNSYRIENVVVYPWVIGYKYNPFNQHPWQYLDIDLSVPRKAVQ